MDPWHDKHEVGTGTAYEKLLIQIVRAQCGPDASPVTILCSTSTLEP